MCYVWLSIEVFQFCSEFCFSLRKDVTDMFFTQQKQILWTEKQRSGKCSDKVMVIKENWGKLWKWNVIYNFKEKKKNCFIN